MPERFRKPIKSFKYIANARIHVGIFLKKIFFFRKARSMKSISKIFKGRQYAFSDDIVNTKLYKQRLYCICNSTCFRYEVSDKCFVTLGNATGVGEWKIHAYPPAGFITSLVYFLFAFLWGSRVGADTCNCALGILAMSNKASENLRENSWLDLFYLYLSFLSSLDMGTPF